MPHGNGATVKVNGWEYEDDVTGENFADAKAGDVFEYLRPFGGPLRVVDNESGVLTLERLNRG